MTYDIFFPIWFEICMLLPSLKFAIYITFIAPQIVGSCYRKKIRVAFIMSKFYVWLCTIYIRWRVFVSKTILMFWETDLSECQLMSIPDAIYHLMRNTVLLSCNLSSNVLRKIPPKFAVKFTNITGKSFLAFCQLFLEISRVVGNGF